MNEIIKSSYSNVSHFYRLWKEVDSPTVFWPRYGRQTFLAHCNSVSTQSIGWTGCTLSSHSSACLTPSYLSQAITAAASVPLANLLFLICKVSMKLEMALNYDFHGPCKGRKTNAQGRGKNPNCLSWKHISPQERSLPPQIILYSPSLLFVPWSLRPVISVSLVCIIFMKIGNLGIIKYYRNLF